MSINLSYLDFNPMIISQICRLIHVDTMLTIITTKNTSIIVRKKISLYFDLNHK